MSSAFSPSPWETSHEPESRHTTRRRESTSARANGFATRWRRALSLLAELSSSVARWRRQGHMRCPFFLLRDDINLFRLQAHHQAYSPTLSRLDLLSPPFPSRLPRHSPQPSHSRPAKAPHSTSNRSPLPHPPPRSPFSPEALSPSVQGRGSKEQRKPPLLLTRKSSRLASQLHQTDFASHSSASTLFSTRSSPRLPPLPPRKRPSSRAPTPPSSSKEDERLTPSPSSVRRTSTRNRARARGARTGRRWRGHCWALTKPSGRGSEGEKRNRIRSVFRSFSDCEPTVESIPLCERNEQTDDNDSFIASHSVPSPSFPFRLSPFTAHDGVLPAAPSLDHRPPRPLLPSRQRCRPANSSRLRFATSRQRGGRTGAAGSGLRIRGC
jgi:hypothetical protein